MSDHPFELRIDASSEKYGLNDARWMQQVDSLYSDLHSDVGKLRKEVEPVEGQKGGVETIILALGTAGAFTAAVQMFQAWLARDRTRNLTLTVIKDGVEKSVTVTGKGMNEATIEKLMEAGLG